MEEALIEGLLTVPRGISDTPPFTAIQYQVFYLYEHNLWSVRVIALYSADTLAETSLRRTHMGRIPPLGGCPNRGKVAERAFSTTAAITFLLPYRTMIGRPEYQHWAFIGLSTIL